MRGLNAFWVCAMSSLPTLAEVCTQAGRLPCSPVLLPRLIGLLERENAGVDAFEALLKLDPALAGATLRVANSAPFSEGHELVDTLGAAVSRIGQQEIYRLVALSLTGRWPTRPMPGYRWEAGDFCRFALVTAVAAEYLATSSGRVDPNVAYTAGLVHEIGKLAFAYAGGEFFPRIRAHQQALDCTWTEAERAVMGFAHPEVTAELLHEWNFPPDLTAAGLHNPPAASAPSDVLPLLVHLHAAKCLAAMISAGLPEDGFLSDLNSSLLLEWGFKPEVLARALPEVLARANVLLGEKLTHGAIVFAA